MFALEIEDLTKVYPSGIQALKGISLRVPEGDFFALLGPNGAGKSTCIGVISSLIIKTSGCISISGLDIDAEPHLSRAGLGVVAQEFNLNMFETAYDVVFRQGGYHGLSRRQSRINTERYLRALQLWDRRDLKVRELSGGMKRRLMVAKAMVNDGSVLILDEPTAGVDVETRHATWDFLRELNGEGKTIILTTHYLEEAEQLCRDVAIINNGELIANTSVSDLLHQLEVETFIFDLAAPLEGELRLGGLEWRRREGSEVEVDLPQGETLNRVFAEFSRCGIEVISMRTRASRLEEAFVSSLGEYQQ